MEEQAVPTLDLELFERVEKALAVGRYPAGDDCRSLLALARSASELRAALELATSALVTIDDTRGPPATQRQSAAVDELRRILGVCRLALGKAGE